MSPLPPIKHSLSNPPKRPLRYPLAASLTVLSLVGCVETTEEDGSGGVVPLAPTLSLVASLQEAETSETFTLTWTSQEADECVASGDWSGTADTNGSSDITETSTGLRSYTLTCSGEGGSTSATVEVSILERIPDQYVIDAVYFAQTHVNKHDAPYFNLTADRDALLHVNVISSTNDNTPAPRLTATILRKDGEALELPLDGPDLLPTASELSSELGQEEHSFDTSFNARIPADFVQPGIEVTLSQRGTEQWSQTIDVGAPNAMTLTMFDVHYFEHRDDFREYADGVFEETEAKLPVSSLDLRVVPDIVFEELIVPARPDVGTPIVRVSSKSQYQTKTGEPFDGEQAAALQWVDALSAAGGNHDFAMEYINIIGVWSGGQAGGFDGVGQVGYAGLMLHEVGHTLGLPHWGNNLAYPYQGDMHGIKAREGNPTHAGPIWAYDLRRDEFLPPVLTNASVASNISNFSSFKGTFTVDPMQGGGEGDQPEGYFMRHFSDYSAEKMQIYTESKLVKLIDGNYFRWDSDDGSYSRAEPENQTGVRHPLPDTIDQPVISVMAGMSLADLDVNMIYPPIGPYIGNQVYRFEADKADDRDRMNDLNVCGRRGECDFTLEVTQGGTTKRYIINASAEFTDDAYDRGSLKTRAINLPASDGDVTRMRLYHTPNVNQVGIGNNPQLLASWSQ